MFYYFNSHDYGTVGKLDGTSQLLLDFSKLEDGCPPETCFPRNVKANFDMCQHITPFKLAFPSTNLTDFCSTGQITAFQRVVSPKVKAIFDSFIGHNAHFFPVHIYQQDGTRHDYYLLHFQESLSEDFIDFDKTLYSIVDNRGQTIDEVIGRSNIKTDKSLIPMLKRFHFKEEKNIPDFFVTPLRRVHFLSDRLTDYIMAEELKGLCIYKYDNRSDLGINTIHDDRLRVY
jgi:hypothetical protein